MAFIREAKTEAKKKAILVGVDFDKTFALEQYPHHLNKLIYTGLSKERWIAFFDAIKILAEKNGMTALLCGVTHRNPRHFITKKMTTAEEEKRYGETADEMIKETTDPLKAIAIQNPTKWHQTLIKYSIASTQITTALWLESPVL